MVVKKITGALLGIIAFICISFFIPTSEVWTAEALRAIGILVCAIFWILFSVLPDFVCALGMIAVYIITKTVTVGVALAPFSASTVWMLICALGLGAAASKSGLLTRISLILMRRLSPTYVGQCLALIVSGVIVSPLIPSTGAKSTIVAPLALSTANTLGVQPHSKPAAGVFLSFYTGYISAANGFLSASFISYTLIGLMPEGKEITWMNWFTYGLVFLIVSVVLMALVIIFYYGPKEKIEVPKEKIIQQLKDLGPWTRKEKIALTVLVCCLVLWMFERVLNIPSFAVALVGMLVMISFDIMDYKDFRTTLPWENIFFVGAFLCVASIFTNLKIDAAIAATIGNSLDSVLKNPYLLVFSWCILTFVLRTFIVSNSTCVVLMTLILMPLCPQYGIHPFILIFVGYAAANIWTLIYQNSPTIMSLAAQRHELVVHNEVASGSLWYMAICIVACLASVPIWQMMGLL